MKDLPEGKLLTIKTIIDGIAILAVSYKYNSKNIFCAPKGAGATIDGEPYVTRSPYQHGNV
jgi:hypothetical protein